MFRKLSMIAAILAGSVLLGSAVFADTLVSHAFGASEPMNRGTLVSLSANPDIVEPATTKNAKNLVGVIVPQQSLFVEGNTDNGVQVATSGIVNVFVSTLNGPIVVGDRIAPSVLEGFGAKAVQSGTVAGVAQASLDDHSKGAIKTEVTDTVGKKHTVYVGQIPVLLNVTYFQSGQAEAPQNAFIGNIQQIAEKLAGRSLGFASVVAIVIILIMMILLCAVSLYTVIRSSIISIGRNPLAGSAVGSGVMRVGLLLVVILGVGFAAIFLILQIG